MMEKFKELLGSRRFYALLLGAVLNCVNTQLKIFSDEQLLSLTGLLAVWIGAESYRSTSQK